MLWTGIKRRLNGAVSGNNRIKRLASCWCLDGHVKEPYIMSMVLGARPYKVQRLLQSACTSMCHHIVYDWNIVDCDVGQPIRFTSFISLQMVTFRSQVCDVAWIHRFKKGLRPKRQKFEQNTGKQILIYSNYMYISDGISSRITQLHYAKLLRNMCWRLFGHGCIYFTWNSLL